MRDLASSAKLVATVAQRGGPEIAAAVEFAVAGSGAAGRYVLADEPDDAADRVVVRGVAFCGAPGHRHGGSVVGVGAGSQRRIDQVAIVDGTLIPDSGSSGGGSVENYWYPDNRNDCTVYRKSGIDQQLAGRPRGRWCGRLVRPIKSRRVVHQ